MTGLDLLKQQFNGHVAFRERRPGVLLRKEICHGIACPIRGKTGCERSAV